MDNINKITRKLEQLKGARGHLKEQVLSTRNTIKELKQSLIEHEQAREIMRQVGIKTQQQLQFHISDITSLALNTVFGDGAYELKAEFVQRRNQTECDLLFVRNGQEIDPLEASGYGAVDVASFALRVVSWSMKNPRSRNTIVLDEPMRFLSTDFQPMASRLLKELSQRLGLQFIIVTHEDILSEYADRVFHVKQDKKTGISTVIQTQN
jgi:chromosome segregation ATPase